MKRQDAHTGNNRRFPENMPELPGALHAGEPSPVWVRIAAGVLLVVSVTFLFMGSGWSIRSVMRNILDDENSAAAAVDVQKLQEAALIQSDTDASQTETALEADDALEQEQSGSEAAASSRQTDLATEAYIDEENGRILLPSSNEYLGLPAYERMYASFEPSTSSLSLTMYTKSGLKIEIISGPVASTPFTRSEEEDYFSQELGYSRIEGSEDLYFYTVQRDASTLSGLVVDCVDGRLTSIDISREDKEPLDEDKTIMKQAVQVLNMEILDASSVAQSAMEEGQNSPSAQK